MPNRGESRRSDETAKQEKKTPRRRFARTEDETAKPEIANILQARNVEIEPSPAEAADEPPDDLYVPPAPAASNGSTDVPDILGPTEQIRRDYATLMQRLGGPAGGPQVPAKALRSRGALERREAAHASVAIPPVRQRQRAASAEIHQQMLADHAAVLQRLDDMERGKAP